MQKSRWWRPSLAFFITFGVMAMGGSLLRMFVVYRRLFALGMQTDDPNMAADANRELSRLDQLYTPTFLLVAFGVSLMVAGVFAWWRPQAKANLPPLLPTERGAETR